MFYPEYHSKLLQFVESNKSYKELLPEKQVLMGIGPEVKGEIEKYYVFNQTGNIMVSSTAPDEQSLGPDIKEVFRKASVLFVAFTAALTKKGKTLYDFDAIDEIINKSGFFTGMHKEDRSFDSSSHDVTLNAAIIAQVLGSVTGVGSALIIAQKVLNSIGNEIKLAIREGKSSKKIAHLLFVVENLMGMPLINVSLFCVEAREAEFVTESPCHKTVGTRINFNYHQDSYLFVDPTFINDFADEFMVSPEFEKLTNQLADYITD